MIDAELLKILACPWCVTRPEKGKSTLARGELKLLGSQAQPEALKCTECGREYKIADGLPNFLIEEALCPETKAKAPA